jgi:ankyrin repeat protein
MAAVRNNHGSLVATLLEHDADVHMINRYKETALSIAALSGSLPIVELLVSRGADVNAVGAFGCTALLCASKEGHHAVVELLLEAQADVNHMDYYDRTALMKASTAEVALTLLEAGAYALASGRSGTPLSHACQRGHADVAKVLLEARVDATQGELSNVFFQAHDHHAELVRLLLAAGARVGAADSQWRTVLHRAAACSWPRTPDFTAAVGLLLENAGLALDSCDLEGRTPLNVAVASRHSATALQLIEARADVTIADEGGTTALMLAVGNQDLALVRALLAAGAGASAVAETVYGSTALSLACSQTYVDAEIVRELLKTEAVSEIDRCEHGRSLLLEAVCSRDGPLVQVLLEAKASVDLVDEDDGATALIVACNNDSEDDGAIVKGLLAARADANATDFCGNTSLIGAFRSGQMGLLPLLLEAGADPLMDNFEGESAAMVAPDDGDIAVMLELLLEHILRNYRSDK